MSYRNTTRAAFRASVTLGTWSPHAAHLDALTRGVPRHQASGYDPRGKMDAYVEHVESAADELRGAVASWDGQRGPICGDALADAARALLAAIGEGD